MTAIVGYGNGNGNGYGNGNGNGTPQINNRHRRS